jgi:DNA repair exonuclease SbcCD ATPase subunit
MVLPWIYPYQKAQWQIKARKSEIHTLVKNQKGLIQQLESSTEHIRQLRTEVENLTKENESTFRELRDHGGTTPDLENEQYIKVEEAEEVFIKRIDELEKQIQKNSQKRVQER